MAVFKKFGIFFLEIWNLWLNWPFQNSRSLSLFQLFSAEHFIEKLFFFVDEISEDSLDLEDDHNEISYSVQLPIYWFQQIIQFK